MEYLLRPFSWLVASNSQGLQPLDWLLLVIYGLSTIALGWFVGRKQKSTEEYFVGSGNMNPFLVGVSLFATLLSTISYRSMPGEALGKGPASLTMFLALPFVYVAVAYIVLPVYMRQRVTSAYELLEEKLGLSVRLLGAVMFLALRLVWMSLLIYVAGQALAVMAGLSEDWIPLIVLITGTVSIIYTSLGGLRAVVVTDLMQTILLFGGAWLVILTVTWMSGGVGWIPTTWQPHWDQQPIFSFDPKTRLTMVGWILSSFIWFVATLGGDQTSVQRFMATRDVRAARRSLATQMMVTAIVGVTLFLVGCSLLDYYRTEAAHMTADNVFPDFIAKELPVGISGLVLAGLFAAAMSSVDSGVNSITAVVSTDFLDRFGLRPKSEKGHILFARLLALGIGVIVVIGSTYIKAVPGNITAVTQKSVNLLTTPIFGLFFFALFVPFARPIGVWSGAVCGTLTAAIIAFSGPLVAFLHPRFGVDPEIFGVGLREDGSTIQDPISFQWIGPIALAVNLAVGLLVSYLAGIIRRTQQTPGH